MKTTYEAGMTMRDARKRYFEVNGFGPNGGYDAAWVEFSIGPIPLPFPNTAGRVRAVGFHDLHHILTGFDTNVAGEFEISAWELAAGCKDMAAAWWLNLGGLAGGILSSPRRTFRAFVRGRNERTTYGDDQEALLDLTVAEARARFAPFSASGEAPAATFADGALFALTALLGFVVGTISLGLGLVLVPVGLVVLNVLRRTRADRAPADQAFATTSTSSVGSGASSSTPTR